MFWLVLPLGAILLVVWITVLASLFEEDLGCLTVGILVVVPFGIVVFLVQFLLKQLALMGSLRQVIRSRQ